MPLISVGLFFAVMVLAFWQINEHQVSQQESSLYRNTALAAQQMRLSMLSIEDQSNLIAHIPSQKEPSREQLSKAFSRLILNRPEISMIMLLSNTGAVLQESSKNEVLSKDIRTYPSHNPLESPFFIAFLSARNSHRIAYSTPIYVSSGVPYLAFHIPLFREGVFNGTLSVIYSIPSLLAHELPQKISDKYKVSLTNPYGQELATTSTRSILPNEKFKELLLDPPGHSLSIRIYEGPITDSLANQSLTWLTIGLAGLALLGVLGSWQSAKKRNAAQHALYEEVSFRRAIENSVAVGMRVTDLKGKITYVNPAFCRLVGYEMSEIMGRLPPYPYWPEEDIPELINRQQRILNGESTLGDKAAEMRLRHKEGYLFYIRSSVAPLLDQNEQQTGWMFCLTDISESKRAQEELALSHERFTTVLESLDISISVFAPQLQQLLFANRHYKKLFGNRSKGHLRLGQYDVAEPHAPPPPKLEHHLIEQAPDIQEVHLQKEGKWFEVRQQYIQWVDGHIAHLQIATDITERRHTEQLARKQEQELQFVSRLVTMGEMASSLAHELNQPLSAISNYCFGAITLLQNSQEIESKKFEEIFKKTLAQATRAGLIIKRIRSFVKRSEPKLQVSTIDQIITNTLELIETTNPIHIEVIKPNVLPDIYADPILIEQVLLNLIKNAAEAMTELVLNSEVPPIILLEVLPVLPHSGQIEITVTDHGPGISEENMSQLFKSFYTTKPNGMGMGLNICRSIIEMHGGKLWAKNSYDEYGICCGCVFHISLPLNPTLVEG